MSASVKRLLPLSALVFFLAGCATGYEPEPRVARAAPIPVLAGPLPGADPYFYPADAPPVLARAAMMIDARTGRTLYYKNPDLRIGPASTLKLLTALTLLDDCDLDGMVTVAASDTYVEPSRLGFRAGDTYRRRDVLNAMMVKSSNDAANLLARTCAGSVAAFMDRMNTKAAELGATDSYFYNPHGLTYPSQHSTARDMARIAFAAYRQPVLRQMMRMPSFNFRYASGRTATLQATNKLLTRSPIYTGMKTGYTAAAGRCLISSASAGGREIILVQFGSRTTSIFNDAQRLTEWQLGRDRFY